MTLSGLRELGLVRKIIFLINYMRRAGMAATMTALRKTMATAIGLTV